MQVITITENRKREHSFLLTAFWSLLVFILSTLGAAAETITVTNANDTGAGSPRQAVIDANFGDDTIVFDATFFSTPRTITLAADRINIRGNNTINGPGANLFTGLTVTNSTISGNAANADSDFGARSGRGRLQKAGAPLFVL